ncbi:hypothetical protein IQ07DRAFT_340732 [Pyrenochaeta sp. DS3sAY3a]|nr:hypothetical protein IQ07DRAFT_340732 [Pyrenochaeta sp. DS3sAY3a]
MLKTKHGRSFTISCTQLSKLSSRTRFFAWETNAFNRRKSASQANFWKYTLIIETQHPGYSVNWHPNDAQKRQQLLRSIYKVCHRVNKRRDERESGNGYANSNINAPITNLRLLVAPSTDLGFWKKFLDVIMMLCFKPEYCLPVVNIVPGPSYYLEDWHMKWFECMRRRYGQPSVRSEDRARALIIPVVEQLNRCLKRVSWFQPIYHIEETVVPAIIVSLTSEFEQACYLVAAGGKMGVEHEHHDCSLARVSRMTWHATCLWESRAHRPKRNMRYVGSSKT